MLGFDVLTAGEAGAVAAAAAAAAEGGRGAAGAAAEGGRGAAGAAAAARTLFEAALARGSADDVTAVALLLEWAPER